MRTLPRSRRLPRRTAVALTTVALGVTLVAAGCGGGGDDSDETGATPGATAAFVPASAPVYVEVDADTESEQWQAASALAAKFPSWPGGSVDEVLAEQLQDAGVDYDTEIKPVLGDSLALAVPTLEANVASTGDLDESLISDQDRFLLVAQLAEGQEEQATKILSDDAGAPAGDHGGVEYFESGDSVAAVWNGGLVIAAEQEDLFASIDASQAGGDQVLSGQEQFTNVLGSLPENVIGQLYVDIGQVVTETADKETLNQLGGIEQVADAVFGMSVTAEADGLRMNGRVQGAVVEELPTFDPTLAENAPADALVYYGFADLAEQVQRQLEQTEGGQDIQEQLNAASAQLQSVLGISLDDIIALATGEHAVVVEPGDPNAEIPVSGALVLKVEDGARAQKTLDAIRTGLPTLLQSFGGSTAGLQWEQVSVAPGVTGWTLPVDAETSLTYAVDGDLAVIGLTPDAVKSVLAPAQPLAANEDFATAIAGAPSPVSGLLWVDIAGAVNLADQMGEFQDDPEALAELRPLQSLVMWTAGGSEPEFEAFLRIE